MEEIKQAPVPCARDKELDICFEGCGWESPRTHSMMEGFEETRYADICGTDIQAMADVGWQFIADPVCFTAAGQAGKVVAVAWAAPMCAEDRRAGCNLTYAVDREYEGRGLAKLLTAIAFLAADQVYEGMEFANIECRVDNSGSIAVANSFGFLRYPEGDFSMPVSGTAREAAFYGFRLNAAECRRAARQALEKKGMYELLDLIGQLPSHSLKALLPNKD